MMRRGLLLVGVAGLASGGVFAAGWFNVLAINGEDALSPIQVQAAVERGDILLVDIRRPDEWAATGIAKGAVPVDMRRADFTEALAAYNAADKSRPVALICARGVRSRNLTNALKAAGFTNIIDVPEGMLGSGAGPGWLARGLPVVASP